MCVVKDLVNYVTYKDTPEHIQMTKYDICGKRFVIQVTLKETSEHALVTSFINVMYVVNDLVNGVTYKDKPEYTGDKPYNVMYVVKDLVNCVTSKGR